MTLIEGANGQGKSNLIEAIYLLVIAKSLRASSDRELVFWQQSIEEEKEIYTQLIASVERTSGPVKVQVVFKSSRTANDGNSSTNNIHLPEPKIIQKFVRLNDIPRKASELIGEVTAVMFTAMDLELIFGSPSIRRRYLDILISQFDRQYLHLAQRYQRIISQRNHLLKSIANRHSSPEELEFWNKELVECGRYIMAARSKIIRLLSSRVEQFYKDFSTDKEICQLIYDPSIEAPVDGTEDSYEQALKNSLEKFQDREIAQGHTITGPHRDDLIININRRPASKYASRGQGRTAVFAMKLSEASNLQEASGHHPILLLDDVLSELDSDRRSQLLKHVSEYHQSFITTADPEAIDNSYLSRMTRYSIKSGKIQPVS